MNRKNYTAVYTKNPIQINGLRTAHAPRTPTPRKSPPPPPPPNPPVHTPTPPTTRVSWGARQQEVVERRAADGGGGGGGGGGGISAVCQRVREAGARNPLIYMGFLLCCLSYYKSPALH
jgi:hypothetical protein